MRHKVKASTKLFFGILACSIVLITAAGCIITSFHPFYTEDAVIELPEIKGEWQLVSIGEDKVDKDEHEPWSFGKDTIEILEPAGQRSVLDTTYFKVQNTVFLDTTAVEADENDVGLWWAMHVVPTHLLSKVMLEGDSLRIVPLDYEWFEDNTDNSEGDLPSITDDKSRVILYTATPEQWMAFLKEHHNDKDIYLEDNTYVLERHIEGGEQEQPPIKTELKI